MRLGDDHREIVDSFGSPTGITAVTILEVPVPAGALPVGVVRSNPRPDNRDNHGHPRIPVGTRDRLPY